MAVRLKVGEGEGFEVKNKRPKIRRLPVCSYDTSIRINDPFNTSVVLISFSIVHNTAIYPPSCSQKTTSSLDLDKELIAPPPMSADAGAQEIVIDEDVENVLHYGALRERLQDPSPSSSGTPISQSSGI